MIMEANGVASSFVVTASIYSGVTNGGGGVKVGNRVEVGTTTNCAARVGSMVEVAGGTGVGGDSTIRNVPGGET